MIQCLYCGFITPSTYFLPIPVILLLSLMKLDSSSIHESSRSNKLQHLLSYFDTAFHYIT